MIGYNWYIVKVKVVVKKVSFVSSNKSMTTNFTLFFIIVKVISYDWCIIKMKVVMIPVKVTLH